MQKLTLLVDLLVLGSPVPSSVPVSSSISLVQTRSIRKTSKGGSCDSAWRSSIKFQEHKDIFPKKWYEFGHVGTAGRNCVSPFFPDFNGDGILDFFYHNHYKLDPVSGWDFGIHTTDFSRSPWYYNTSALSLVNTETGKHDPSDTHGIAILDIDRDGALDLYISVGGGEGRQGGPDHNAILMWGEQGANPVKFVGGRDVAEAARLHNPDSRGRFAYFADFNNDGLLDVVFGNDVRADNENAVGYLMYNRGNRTFEPEWRVAEYANSMILTDANGDGHADEFIVARRNCLPKQEDAPKPTGKLEAFCSKRPPGTSAIFKYDPGHQRMDMVASEDESDREFPDFGVSMQSGDFDGDGVADLVVLRRSRLTFYYSKGREVGQWPLGKPSEIVLWSMHACAGLGLRAADFDLDGQLELLVMCEEYGLHRMYKQGADNGWHRMEGGLGDIEDKQRPLLAQDLEQSACTFTERLPFIEDFCAHLRYGKKIPDTVANGISVVDFNNDGYMDVIIAHDWGTLMVMANEGGTNRFIALKLIGTVSNEYGIGATIILRVRHMGSECKDTVEQFREVNTASHETDWWGGRDDRIVFGLGTSGVVEEIQVRWPGKHKKVQIVNDMEWMQSHVGSMRQPLIIREPVD